MRNIIYLTAGVSKLCPAGQMRPAKPFYLACDAILSIMKKWYIYENFFDLVECNIFRNNHIMQDVWPSNCCVKTCVTLGQKSLKTPALQHAPKRAREEHIDFSIFNYHGAKSVQTKKLIRHQNFKANWNYWFTSNSTYNITASLFGHMLQVVCWNFFTII